MFDKMAAGCVFDETEKEILNAINSIRQKRIRPDKDKILSTICTVRNNYDIYAACFEKLERNGIIFSKTTKHGLSYFVNKLLTKQRIENISHDSSQSSNINSLPIDDYITVDKLSVSSVFNDACLESSPNQHSPRLEWLYELLNKQQETIQSLSNTVERECERNRILSNKIERLNSALRDQQNEILLQQISENRISSTFVEQSLPEVLTPELSKVHDEYDSVADTNECIPASPFNKLHAQLYEIRKQKHLKCVNEKKRFQSETINISTGNNKEDMPPERNLPHAWPENYILIAGDSIVIRIYSSRF